jgi:hypothetical protein
MESKEEPMTYTTTAQLQVSNVDAMAHDFAEFAQAEYLAAGALSASMRQVVMGGDASGMVAVVLQWETIDTAMTGHIVNASPKISESMAKNGAQIVGRSLAQIMGEVGTPEGPYGSMLTMSGQDAPQEVFDHTWSLMSGNGVNGIRTQKIIAGGNRTGLFTAATFCESLDGLMENSAKMFSNPTVQANMAQYNNQLVSRSMFRTLVA